MKKSEKEIARMREESRIELEKQQAAVEAAQKAHKAAMEEQEALRLEIEREKEAKARAEALNAELNVVCNNLKHKALAFAMQQAREKRKADEAKQEAARLSEDVTKGAAQISEL
jgi:hypothetical protein